MTDDNEKPDTDPPVAELGFLARSPHRIQLLTQLSREERTRREIHEKTGISQPTLGRILGDFEQRHWISNNHDGTYVLTPLGNLLADTIVDLLGVLDTIGHLADLTEHLPLGQLEFDLKYLSTATITTPSSADPLAHMRRFDELAARAATAQVFSNVLQCAPAHKSSATEQEFLTHVDELIVTKNGLVTGFDDPVLEKWLRDRIANGDLTLYKYEQPAAFLFGVFDETVGIVPIDDTGMPCGLIEAETDPIHSWVVDTFEEYRRAATRVTPAVLLG